MILILPVQKIDFEYRITISSSQVQRRVRVIFKYQQLSQRSGTEWYKRTDEGVLRLNKADARIKTHLFVSLH